MAASAHVSHARAVSDSLGGSGHARSRNRRQSGQRGVRRHRHRKRSGRLRRRDPGGSDGPQDGGGGARPVGCGGTCLLRGCIPTKALLHTADLYEELKHGKEFGIVADRMGIDFPAVMAASRASSTGSARASRATSSRRTRSRSSREKAGSKAGSVIVKGAGGETRVETKNVILATGSRPRSLPASDRRQDDPDLGRDPRDQGPSQEPGRDRRGRGGHRVRVRVRTLRVAVTVIEMLPRILPAGGRGDLRRGGQDPRKADDHPRRGEDRRGARGQPGVEVAFRVASGEASRSRPRSSSSRWGAVR